ncbi:DUF4350 domain-containing protein [Olivibacter sitiensis]|uniref:DUF4350 domain-containing protein n=1 Tax=Olivibacter sitiensis TaxID=376470 RepID=UPI000416F3B9|nr:DUF4350 domain-containing protein [Olivibacter sitiensis]
MKGLRIYIISLSLLLLAYLYVQYRMPSRIDWTPSFKRTDKIPFGTYILYKELTQQHSDKVRLSRKSLYQTIQQQYDQHFNLLIIAPEVTMSETEYSIAKRAMKQGNDIFLATKRLPKAILDSLKVTIKFNNSPFEGPSSKFNFTNSHFHQEQPYVYDHNLGNSYFGEIDTTSTSVLATNANGDPIFIKINHGLGNFYFMSSPDFFSNYALLQPRGMDFAAKALSYIAKHRPLLLDEFQTRGREGDTDLFSVLYRYTSLSWAYYIALIAVILFVIYDMKRRQRIIPIKDPMPNTTLEFIRVIGDIYVQQHNNKDIAHKKTVYFMENIRSNYGLRTNHMNREFISTLAARSGVDTTLIARICKEIDEINKGKYPNDDELIAFSNDIDSFYQQSKIIIWNKNLKKEKT